MKTTISFAVAKHPATGVPAPVTITKRLLPFAVLVCALLWGSAFAGIKAIYAAWAEIVIAAMIGLQRKH